MAPRYREQQRVNNLNEFEIARIQQMGMVFGIMMKRSTDAYVATESHIRFFF